MNDKDTIDDHNLVGSRLDTYELTALLGSGGMGCVYKARDTRLERLVAIKVLPAHLAGRADARERFKHEARAIASLNHHHICTLYDVGQQDGVAYLVMEYLEGETLGDRLKKGPLPLGQVLRYAAEIADALDKAHQQGITHRDLKPANIMITKSGSKLLDFGLAKLTQAGDKAHVSASELPTAQLSLTAERTILGTLQYMAPEQLEGKEADARSDIFAFGAVLYEMISGDKAFPSESQAALIATILTGEPRSLIELGPMTPPALARLVRTCLTKDADERRQSMHDVLLELKWIAESGSQAAAPPPVVSHRKVRERLAQAAALVLALTTIALAIGLMMRAPKQPQSMRLRAEIGVDANLNTIGGPAAILAPDGTQLVLRARGADQQLRLYVRGLDQLQAVPLPGTEDPGNHFFSPDGKWIGFFAGGKLKKISVQGGAEVTLCDAAFDSFGSWSEDGTIVFASHTGGLFRVSSTGGTPEPLTTLDKQAGEVTHRWPQVLPGGQAVLFTSNTFLINYQDADIVVYSLSTKQRKTVHRGGFYPRYLLSGHLVYVNEGTLFAVPFDLERLEVTGPAAPILEGVVASPGIGGAQFSFSDTGNLVYAAGASGGRNLSISWMDHEGKFTPLRENPGEYSTPRFSPDGKRLALHVSDGNEADIWVYDWERDTAARLTSAGEANRYASWTPDGLRVAYESREKGGAGGLFWIRADGSGEPQRLTESRNQQIPNSWRPDGKVLAFHQDNPGTRGDIMTLSIEGNEDSGWKPGKPQPFLASSSSEWRPAFSPDGHWLAYTSDESGNDEVYVRPFPGPGGKWQISSGGGRIPKWSRHSKELFYRTRENRIVVATYTATGDSFNAEKPRQWSPGQFTNAATGDAGNFDLHPDGKRFAVLMPPGREGTAKVDKVTFIFNFFDELRRKVPGSGK
jgi:tRNA A-37 threonylcarbamoyl transferase component Bud32